MLTLPGIHSSLPATLSNAYGSFSHPAKRQWHQSTRAFQGLARHERAMLNCQSRERFIVNLSHQLQLAFDFLSCTTYLMPKESHQVRRILSLYLFKLCPPFLLVGASFLNEVKSHYRSMERDQHNYIDALRTCLDSLIINLERDRRNSRTYLEFKQAFMGQHKSSLKRFQIPFPGNISTAHRHKWERTPRLNPSVHSSAAVSSARVLGPMGAQLIPNYGYTDLLVRDSIRQLERTHWTWNLQKTRSLALLR